MYFTITTFGCKVNQYESSGLAEFMRQRGYTETRDSSKADVHIINSCTVTENGDKKVRRLISAIKRDNPKAMTVLCGCLPRAFPEKAEASGANVVIKSPVSTLLENLPFSPQPSRTRAFLKIEDGCNRNCSYCIIPRARGEVRCRPLPDVISEARKLAEFGHKEIVLTGINLGLFPGLYEAAADVCGVPGIERVRLSSLEPDLIDEKLIADLAKLPKFCPHFHISLQSGSDEVLRRMRRRYDTAYYRRLVGIIRENFRESAVTTDIIAGFPGETDSEFAETLAFAEEMAFAKIHVFAYSKRGGTEAARMPNQVAPEVKRGRVAKLCGSAARMRAEFFAKLAGSIQEVLVEKDNSGHTRNYAPVKIIGGDYRKNDVVTGVITGATESEVICTIR